MIFGGESEESGPKYAASFGHYAGLLMNPICMSASYIAMRQIKKLNDLVVSTWMVLSYLAVFLPLCLIIGEDLWVFIKFDGLDWACIVSISITMVVMQTVRLIAIACQPLSGLQPYTFLVPVQQMITDLLLFDLEFILMQISRLLLLIGVYLSPWLL